jgi:hypothetical protein
MNNLEYHNDRFLIQFFVSIVQAHPFGEALLKGAEAWQQLETVRREYLEAVGYELLDRGFAHGSAQWNEVLLRNAIDYADAIARSAEYGLQEDAVILQDCIQHPYPYYIWLALTSQMAPNRVKNIEDLAEEEEALMEAYADF